MKWVDDPSNQAQIIWIFDPAGAGKSAIAQSIADFCFQSDNLVASFFFSRYSAGRDNAVQFITTLAYQLSRSIPEMKAAVVKVLEDDPLSHSLHAQAHGLIIRPLNDAFTIMGNKKILNFRPRLVIIDGLDECGKPKDQRYLLEVLSTIGKQLSYPLLFSVASRPEQAIRKAFNKEPLRILTTRLALDDAYEADSDIRIFLQSKFDEIKQNHPAGGTYQAYGLPEKNLTEKNLTDSSKNPPDNLSMPQQLSNSWILRITYRKIDWTSCLNLPRPKSPHHLLNWMRYTIRYFPPLFISKTLSKSSWFSYYSKICLLVRHFLTFFFPTSQEQQE